MAAGVRADVTVARPAAEVFAYLADPANDVAWRSEVTAVTHVGGTAGTPGASYREHLSVSGRDVEIGLVITAVSNPSSVTFQVDGPVDATGGYRLSAQGDGTLVEFHAAFASSGLRRLFDPVVAAAVQRVADGNLQRLRAILEAVA